MMQNANTSVCSTTPWVGIDWGTTNIRAYHMANNTLMNQSSKQIHITDCAKAGFENTLNELIGDWDLRENTSILICDMAGSKIGWVEAPYVNCPAGVHRFGVGSWLYSPKLSLAEIRTNAETLVAATQFNR